MLKNVARFALVSAVAFAASTADAAIVTFSNLTGTWFNGTLTDGNPITVFTNNGTINPSVRWGGDSGFGQSGYNYVAAGTVVTSLTVPGASPDLVLGDFQHVNLPVFPPSAASVFLKLTADVDVDGTGVGAKSFIFKFLHDETTNSLDPCPYGGANGQGININGCADHVTASFAGTSDTFMIGLDTYTLDVLGFSLGGSPAGGFSTTEQQVNTAQLIGRVTVATAAVPEPATWAMMIMGFGLVGGTLRRRAALAA
ncbi:THxN family PEP-CTERM protein [Sandaracinobacteroides saxicola]|uniref:PEP-CTERM sorting domain-containing protein n=1 Tax=Sandaracinobacteroides saxicola TaxID=2759707 RepID=A0A7G5IFK0_9SPHN|nr:THxN family PEP-CTERM protein [Sandaracinobacteroides saxicola]QMW22142.1 PEP-CTERM sorting domain-containing protein [Sandaracinobacteroides saxicola]